MVGIRFSDPRGSTVAEIPVVEGEITVGRATDVDVVLPYKAVSRHHARFFLHQGQLHVEDTGSSNGVVVGGVRCTGAHRLEPGDIVHIGVISVLITQPPPERSTAPHGAPPGRRASHSAPSLPTILEAPATVVTGPALDEFAMGAFPPSRDYLVLDPNAVTLPPPPMKEGVYLEPPSDNWWPDLSPPSPETPPADACHAQPTQLVTKERSRPQTAAPLRPRLVGTSGETAGQVFLMDGADLTVGRDGSCAVVVHDSSVSRTHAKIIRKDDEFILFDLRSFNGTFADDARVARVELKGGERLRFGDVAFSFLVTDDGSGLPISRRSRGIRGLRRRGLLLGLLVLVVLVLGAARLLRRPREAGRQQEARQTEVEAQIVQHLEQGTAELERKNWEEALKAYRAVLRLSPLNDDAVRGFELARSEKERQDDLREAVQIAETGRDLARARDMLRGIPRSSASYTDARLQLRRVERMMANRAREEGLPQCQAGRWEQCHRRLCDFFQLWPAGEAVFDEARIRRQLEQAERQLKKRPRASWTPCAASLEGTGNPATDRDLERMYGEEKIRRTVIWFVQGRSDDALQELRQLEKQAASHPHRDTLSRLLQHILRVETASADAHRNILADRLTDAEANCEQIRRSEEVILPPGAKSHSLKQIGSLLAKRYRQLGEEHFRAARYREAYQAWARGQGFSPEEPEILEALLMLEGRAQEACALGQQQARGGDLAGARQQFELCRDMTPENSILHQQALRGLQLDQ